MNIGEFFVELGVKANTVVLDMFKTKMSDLTVATGLEIGAIYKLGIALKNLGEASVRTAADYSKLNQVYGINSQFLQTYERIGAHFNVTLDETRNSITGLQQNLAAMMLGQGSQGFMRAISWLGVAWKPGETAEEMLPEIEKKGKEFMSRNGKLGPAMLAHLLGQAEIDPALIQEIIAGPEARNKAGKGPNLSDATIAAETKLSEQIATLDYDTRILMNDGISKLVGPVSKIADFLGTAEGGILNPAYSAGNKAALVAGGIGAVFGSALGLPGALAGAAIGSLGTEWLSHRIMGPQSSNNTSNTTIHAHGMTAEQVENLKKRHERKTQQIHIKTMLKRQGKLAQ